MASYTSSELSVPTGTATKVADATDVPREILLRDIAGDAFRVAFTSSDAPTGAKVSDLASGNTLQFMVSPCTEVWVYQASGSNRTLSVLVTGQ